MCVLVVANGGNVLDHNLLGTNNLDGDFDFLTPAPQTTGILIAAGLPFPGPASHWDDHQQQRHEQ